MTRLTKIIIALFLIAALMLMSFGVFFNEQFLLRWSYDGNISPETLREVEQIRIASMIAGIAVLGAWIMMRLNRERVDAWLTKRKNIIQNLLLLAVTLIIIIALSELFLWSILRNNTEGAGFGPGSLNFNEQYVKLNNEGMRDYNFTIEKGEKKRIAVIGDSFTFGAGVKNASEIYSKVLERKLQSEGEWEVYTFAVPGYNAREEYIMLKEKALKYNPDMIIIGFFVNDLANVDEKTKDLSSGVNWRLPLVGYWLRGVSYTYYFLETKFNRLMENIGVKDRWIDSIDIAYRSEINRKHTKEIYKNISIAAGETPIGIVVFPLVTSYYDDYSNYTKFTIAHDFAKEVAEENDWEYLDLLPYYKEYRSEDIIVNPYDAHPNELGHRIAGEAIYSEFFRRE
jgi:hypothetical protein